MYAVVAGREAQSFFCLCSGRKYESPGDLNSWREGFLAGILGSWPRL